MILASVLKGGEPMSRNQETLLSVESEESTRALLESFLRLPLADSDAVFRRFSSLPHAVEGIGSHPMERYLYIPGKRQDRILLVAHADTVWKACGDGGPSAPTEFKLSGDTYHSVNPVRGIGADDRAGCAMLWALRDSGHSLLLLDGEEDGKIGARFLRRHAPRLFREINRTHRMMIALDAPGTHTCIFDQVDYTPAFRAYVETKLRISQGNLGGGSDLQFLCHKICGVNYGVGYLGHHTPGEMLSFSGWSSAYRELRSFLEKEHPRFPIHKRSRVKRNLRRLLRLPRRVCGKLKRTLRG